MLLALACLLAACGEQDTPALCEKLDPEAWFLWPDVEAPMALNEKGSAGTAYILWAETRLDAPAQIVPLRRTRPTGVHSRLWLTVRAESLDWEQATIDAVIDEARRWDAANPAFAGIQIDYDAPTMGLGAYSEFLARLRENLPTGWALSATGLLDWPANATADDLAALQTPLDELVIQTYRETNTVENHDQYLPGLGRLKGAYRVAIIDGDRAALPPPLCDDPEFLGTALFVLPERLQNP